MTSGAFLRLAGRRLDEPADEFFFFFRESAFDHGIYFCSLSLLKS